MEQLQTALLEVDLIEACDRTTIDLESYQYRVQVNSHTFDLDDLNDENFSNAATFSNVRTGALPGS